MSQGNTNNTETQETYLDYLNNYFGKKDDKSYIPICREERQYALFLYNKLLSMINKSYDDISKNENNKKIYDAVFNINNNDESKPIIKKVYYEVTFMRDFLEREKQKYKGKNGIKELDNKEKIDQAFNYKLFNYVKENTENHLNYIIEHSSLVQIKKELEKHNDFKIHPNINYCSKSEKLYSNKQNFPLICKYMSAMMNNKADLGILYELKEKKYLKFVECKYLSGIDIYDFGFKFKMPQHVIQYYITKFICKKLNLDVEAKYPVLVNFVTKNKENKTTNKESICNKCENKLKCNKQDDNCIKFLSEFINGNAKYIKLDTLIPVELKKQ